MPPKRDIGWKFADPVAGSSRIARCKYCGKVMHGGVTRLKEHIAQVPGHVEPCPRAPREVSLMLLKLLCEGRSEATGTKRKRRENNDGSCNMMLSFNLHVSDTDDDILEFEKFLMALESWQLKHAMDESSGVALKEPPYLSPTTESCSRQFSSGVVIIDEDNDEESELELRQLQQAMEESRKLALMEDERVRHYSDPGSSELERKQLTQAMEESRYMAIMAEERQGHFDCGTSTRATSLTENEKMQFNELGIEKMMSATTPEMPLSGVQTTKLKEYLGTILEELELRAGKDTQKGQCDKELALLHENEKLKHEIEELKKQLAEKDEELQDVESLNQTLILKERTSNNELQDARKEMILVMQKIISGKTKIGVKRMGEVDQKSFQEVCSRRFCSDDWEMRSMELNSLWQDKVNDPNWQPFKKISRDGKWEETIDEDDSLLKELKTKWGGGVYKAIIHALLEINEFNPSGRYVVPELWNFKERRKASLKEVILQLVKCLKARPCR